MSSATKFKAAAVQMVSSGNLPDNLAVAQKLIGRAAAQGAALIVLPESFALLGEVDYHQVAAAEVTSAGPIRQFLAEQARQHGVWLVAGTVPIATAAQVNKQHHSVRQPVPTEYATMHAACLVIDHNGAEVGRYNKIHLFDAELKDSHKRYAESDLFLAGNKVLCIDTPFGRLGVAVCYDLRFPELFRILFQKRADIIAVPSAFTRLTGQAHWMTLLRARAIENCCFVIGANQTGQHTATRESHGESVIIGPWGEVLASLEEGEEVVVAEIDLSLRAQMLTTLPVHRHQRIWINDEKWVDD